MTKMVRNIEMPTSTWFGGIDGVPSALRRKPSTIRIRVKPVIMISSDGPSVISVNRPRIERFVPGSWLLPGSGIDSAGSADAAARRAPRGPHGAEREQRDEREQQLDGERETAHWSEETGPS